MSMLENSIIYPYLPEIFKIGSIIFIVIGAIVGLNIAFNNRDKFIGTGKLVFGTLVYTCLSASFMWVFTLPIYLVVYIICLFI